MKTVLACFVSALLGGFVAVWLTETFPAEPLQAQEGAGPAFPGRGAPADPPEDGPPKDDDAGLFPDEVVAVAVYENCNRGVVNITTQTVKTDSFFRMDVPSRGSGSGAIIDKSGHILTNYHVIEGARQVSVTLFDGTNHDATFVGADPVNDIAIIKIDAPRELLHPIRFGDSSRLKPGMRVFAIGNPFGLERTMTTGIISSLNRSLEVRSGRTIKSIIQIDAAVNPGNSGGPLIDAHGKLIGMNTAIATSGRAEQSAGVGFAIPVNLIQRVVPQLIRHGRVIRPEVGITRVYETEEGLLIARLSPNGPAAQAGLRGPKTIRQRRGPFLIEKPDLRSADLIVAIDGKPVKTADDFLGYIEAKRIGEPVRLTIVRENRRIDVEVILGGQLPDEEE